MDNTNMKIPKLSDYLARIETLTEDEKVWMDGVLTGIMLAKTENAGKG